MIGDKSGIAVLALAGLLYGATVAAQFTPEEALFLERWQRLQNDFDAGRLELDERGLPPEHGTQTSKVTERDLFRVSIRSEQQPLPFNQLHNWLVEVTTPDNQPVSGAMIGFLGGMPLHNHGFPTLPVVTGERDAGTYVLEGVKFSMDGWWQMAFVISTDKREDVVSFNIVLEP